jgi:glyoxylase-like metal-dependent hydrolase (beta-lactamase superfamily II)
MQQISENVYQMTVFGFVNLFVLRGPNGIAVIDTAVGAQTVDILTRELATINASLNDIKHILLTHWHFDHCGGLAALQKAVPTARTYAGQRDAHVITGEQKGSYPPRSSLSGGDWLFSFLLASQPLAARVDTRLHEGDALDNVFPDLRVIDLPGHTHGQVGFHLPSRRLLIAGDSMGHYPTYLGMPFRAPSIDWAQVPHSIRKVAALNLHTLAVGHGNAILGDAAAKVNGLVARMGAG